MLRLTGTWQRMKSVPLVSFFHLCIILIFIFPSLYYSLWSFDSVLLCIILLFSQCTIAFESVLIDNWQTHTGTSCRDYISRHPNPCPRMASVRGEFDLGFAADIGATAISCWRTEENQLFLIGSQSYISSLLSDFYSSNKQYPSLVGKSIRCQKKSTDSFHLWNGSLKN